MAVDANILIVFLLTLFSLVLCLGYGVYNWNRDGEISPERAEEEAAWSREEKKIEGELSGEGDL